MAAQEPLISLKLCSPEGERIGLADAGSLLNAIQDLIWHMGSYIEGEPYNEGGRPKKKILENYGLIIKSLSTGSLVVDIGAQMASGQAKFDEGSFNYLPQVNLATNKAGDFIEAVAEGNEQELYSIVGDIAYRSRFLSDISKIWPKKKGWSLSYKEHRGRLFELGFSNREQIERFVSPKTKDMGEEVRIGILADLRVENGKLMRIEKIGENIPAEYPPELESVVRELLGLPVRVFGKAERIQGQHKTKMFHVESIELFEKYPLSEFEAANIKFIPLINIDVQVDYDSGVWILSLPFLDAAGRSENYYEAEQMLMDYIHFLWVEYALCPDEELGDTGKMLKEILQEIFKVDDGQES